MLVAWLHPALWLAWSLYWFSAARGAKAVTRRESWPSRLGHVIPLAIGVWLLIAGGTPLKPLDRPLLPWSPALFAIGTAMLLAGLALAVLARRHLGGNWSGLVTQKRGHELIRSGPYGWTRHPIYTGLLLAFAGSAVALDEWRGVLALLIVTLALMRKLRVEERFLEELFPHEYPRYRREVGALLPWSGSLQRER